MKRTEDEVFELLTRHDSEAVDALRKAIDILKTYSTIENARELLETMWESE